jgi:hypothetical protein
VEAAGQVPLPHFLQHLAKTRQQKRKVLLDLLDIGFADAGNDQGLKGVPEKSSKAEPPDPILHMSWHDISRVFTVEGFRPRILTEM